jgi:predicted metal-dependent HD superfamily phosphohydrolase
MSHDALVSHLSPYWVHLAGRYTGDTGLIHQCFSEIEKAYNCTGRHYHNLRHIQDLLNLSSQYQPYLYDKDTIDFAIFYHDIIYDVSKSDNEERSAGIAESRLKALKLPVVCHPISISCTYINTHDFAARPHAIFSTLQGTQHPDTKLTLQRAKNANAQPTHHPS